VPKTTLLLTATKLMSEKWQHERRRRPPLPQPAKTTLFAGGNEADVRKMAAGHFSNRR
jgi:hypothetical protein